MHPTSRSCLIGVALSALCVTTAAADFRVTSNSDTLDGVCDHRCSLRDAVVAAQAQAGPQRILLPAGLYSMALGAPRNDLGEVLDEDANVHGDYDIRGDIEIVGAGLQTTIIDAGRLDRLFEVFAGARLQLRDLTLRNGLANSAGGGIENKGSTLLRRVRVERSLASALYQPGIGGGIANFGDLTLYQAEIDYNSSVAGQGYRGRGGGIFNAGSLWIRDSLLTRNDSVDDGETGVGGGLYNEGTADIARTTFSGNFSRLSGPAITNLGQLKLSNSTVSGNLETYENTGAALSNGDPLLTPAIAPDALLIHVTIAGNTGSGLSNRGRVRLRNSLIAGNRAGNVWVGFTDSNCENVGAAHYEMAGLLLGTGTGNCRAERYLENARTFTQLLHPLAANNGFTPTHALRYNSAALDAGVGSCASFDQRDRARPRDGDGDGVAVCDLGAYERFGP